MCSFSCKKVYFLYIVQKIGENRISNLPSLDCTYQLVVPNTFASGAKSPAYMLVLLVTCVWPRVLALTDGMEGERKSGDRFTLP